MAKKYLTLEEASRDLGMAPDELVRLRERGEIRGFADRGTWKFKSEDVQEFARSRQADSAPEVPILVDRPQTRTPPDIEVRKGPVRPNKASDSDVRLLLDDALLPGEKGSDPEVVLTRLGTSDSDVRLSDSTNSLVDSGSDSDVKLISTAGQKTAPSRPGSSAEGSSDSDVQLIAPQSDSDVRLAKPAPGKAPRSDSDVRLVGTDDLATLGSESDIRLATGQGSSMVLGGDDSSDTGSSTNVHSTASMKFDRDSGPSDESSVLLGSDSGIALDSGSSVKVGGGSSADSGITLQSLGDSGISLEKVDSGISLAGPLDSGIALDADSGIALDKKTETEFALDEDSGISLAADSGISLEDSRKRGEKKKKPNDRTSPLLSIPHDEDDSTQVEVPTLEQDEDNSYQLHDDGPKKNVVLFADDDEDDKPAAPVRGRKGRPDDSFALAESGVEFAEAEDFSDDEDLEVAEDVLSEDADLDEIDVFEPAEEDFDSSVQSGESHSEFAAPALAVRPAAAPEAAWDGLTFAGLALSGVILLLTGTMMFDLLRTMWHWDDGVIIGSPLLQFVRERF